MQRENIFNQKKNNKSTYNKEIGWTNKKNSQKKITPIISNIQKDE